MLGSNSPVARGAMLSDIRTNTMIERATFKFLNGLKENNNRQWFQHHREEYEQAPEDCLFRINRDVRFNDDHRQGC
jgi:uncharacterized protein (DUF2461 family)